MKNPEGLWADIHVGVRGGSGNLQKYRLALLDFLRADHFPLSSCPAPCLVRQLESLAGDSTNSICWRNNILWQWWEIQIPTGILRKAQTIGRAIVGENMEMAGYGIRTVSF